MTLEHSITPKPSSSLANGVEDCYFDGPYLVFTEAYHRKRGFCCKSGCRHCPYGFAPETPNASGLEATAESSS